MKKYIIFLSVFLISCTESFYITQNSQNIMSPEELEYTYQLDADIIRLEHLAYWSQLIENYYDKTGQYPFQDTLEGPESLLLVKINTQDQMGYFDAGSPKYRPDLYKDGFFPTKTVKEFISELEKGLEISIDEKYDIQKVPTKSTIGYNYFVTQKGYLIWSTCITCGITEISTLLMDGITPTVNIASKDMIPDVTKALSREDMLKHPIFQGWMKRGLKQEEYIRNLEKSYFNDSKK